jgi:hypothetical protein
MADFLDRVLSTLAQTLPEVTADRLRAAEVQIRQIDGGTEAGYIAKRPADCRAWLIGQQLQAGATLGDCFAAAGVKRRQGHYILTRPLRKPGR